MTGRLIAKFTYKNTEQPVKSWVEMYVNVLQILYAEDKSIITKLAYSEEDGLAAHFSANARIFRKSEEIGDGIYVMTNTNTQSKLSNLTRLFKLYGENPEDLVFYLRNQNNADDEPLQKLRRKYWTYALPVIQKANVDTFKNVHPSNSNWIAGTFGISGFYLDCVANYDQARVELVLSKSEKKENKAVFDQLFQKKTEIEAKIGQPLIWDRGDSYKLSTIGIKLKNVSVQNETDWPQMAHFHAKWSKQFYDVLVPYLK